MLKKEFNLHILTFLILFFVFVLLKKYLFLDLLPLFLGGLLGTFLPDMDHLIYIYYLRPYELTSQRARSMLQKHDFLGTWNLLSSTRAERTNLIFHNAWFQILFFILTFWVLSSSTNHFGRWLVLTFSLHLLVDQFIDWKKNKSLNNWFSHLSFSLTDSQTSIYLVASSIALLLLIFLI